MKKRIFSLVLALCMVLSLCSVTASAEGVNVAKIGDMEYKTLTDAISAASEIPTTITLLSDVTESVTIESGKNIILDLNGKTLQDSQEAQDKNSTASKNHTITNSGTLTITDTSTDEGGTVDNKSHARGAIYNNLGATCTIEKGIITRSAEAGTSATNSGNNSWYVVKNDGTMIFNGGEVKANGKFSSLVRNDGTMTINDGKFTNCFIAIKNDEGKLTITGGTFDSEDQAVQNWNEATISGGDFTGAVYSWACTYQEETSAGVMTISGTAKITGNVYAVQYKDTDYSEPAKAAKVTVTGGTIIGNIGAAKSGYSNGTNPSLPAEFVVDGGNYSKSVDKRYLSERLITELVSSSNTDAPYSYHTDVSAAIAAAAEAGDTDAKVNVLNAGTEELVTVTLNLNGGTLSVTSISAKAGETITLPTPTRSGWTFLGWHNGTNIVSSPYTVTEEVTLTAKWSYNNPGPDDSGEEEHDCPSAKFTDVDTTQYYHEAVDWAVTNDVVAGTTPTTFSPNASCTRAQAVTFLWRAAGSPAPTSTVNPFTDVKSGAYYYDAVLWAVENKIVAGITPTTFSPNATVTRAQVAAFLYRHAGSPAVSGSNAFTDVPANAYYADAVQWAVDNKVAYGTSTTAFSPNSNCTRAQTVAFLYRDLAETETD